MSPPPRRQSIRERAAAYASSFRPKTTGARLRGTGAYQSLRQQIDAARLSAAQIHDRQRSIHDDMLRTSRCITAPNFRRLDVADLRRMVRMVDERFFDGRVLPLAEAEGLSFDLSSRMTSAAGKLVTTYPTGRRTGPRHFKLMLSTTLLFQTFEEPDRPVAVTGRRCVDRLEAMQRVVEHEATHLAEMLLYNDGNCSQPRFQSIASRHFGHTDHRHELITGRQRAAQKFGLRPGDRVHFEIRGRMLVGRINRITRRATVLVDDPSGTRYSDGGTYVRYYVPVEQLTRLG